MQATTQLPMACAGCGGALAPDQRYCLHCGTAQGDPRVAYRELIDPARAASGASPPANGTAVHHVAAPLAHPPRDWTPLVALGGLGVLALVLVVGVLIGKSGTPSQSAAPPPQVITIGGGAAAPAATTPAAADAGATAGGKAKKQGRRGAGDADPVDTKAGEQAVQDLNSATGEDYQRKSSKLPDTVALPGEPPPKDNKAPGGGSGAETIG